MAPAEGSAMTLVAPSLSDRQHRLGTDYLARVARRVAGEPRLWRPATVDPATGPADARPGDRSEGGPDGRAVRLIGPPGIDVWLLTWPAGTTLDRHEHDDGPAAFAVVRGTLVEVRDDDVLGVWSTTLRAPAVRVLEPGVVHELRNDHAGAATSIHAGPTPSAPRSGFRA
jgi:quercetin dioxygenase-like cupin family protein